MHRIEARPLRLGPRERVPPVAECEPLRPAGGGVHLHRRGLRQPETQCPERGVREPERGRLVLVGVEPGCSVCEARVGGGELLEQLDDVLLVVERRRFARERVVRPVAGVEAGECRRRGPLHPRRERAGGWILGGRRVRLERDHGLQLSVEHPQRLKRIEADPRAGCDAREQAAGDHTVGGAGLAHQRRRLRRHERCRSRERLCRDGLRHPREPRCASPGVVEEVLPGDPAALLVDAACDQRVGEALRARRVVRGDASVQCSEVGQRVELETASREVAIDEAVGVRHVFLRSGRIVLRKVVVVRLELPDQRKCARCSEAAAECCELSESDGDVLPASARQRAHEVCRSCDLRAAGVRGRAVDSPGSKRHADRFQRTDLPGNGRCGRCCARNRERGRQADDDCENLHPCMHRRRDGVVVSWLRCAPTRRAAARHDAAVRR